MSEAMEIFVVPVCCPPVIAPVVGSWDVIDKLAFDVFNLP